MMNNTRKVDATNIAVRGVVANNNLCGVTTSMSSLNQISERKQFKCISISKNGSFQYVEIITSADGTGNYQSKQQLVDDREKLETKWSDFYFLSRGEVYVQ